MNLFRSTSQTLFYENKLVLGIFIFTFLIIYHPLLQVNGFAFKDDWVHFVITRTDNLHPQLPGYEPVAAYTRGFLQYGIVAEIERGRFRPVYWLLYTLESFVFRQTYRIWQVETLLFGALTAWLIYLICRHLNLGRIPAFLAGYSLIFVAQGTPWAEKQIAEEPGMLLISLLAFSVVKASQSSSRNAIWDLLSLTSLFLVGFIKESFILTLPAIVTMRVTLPLFFDSSRAITFKAIITEIKTLRWFLGAALVIITTQFLIAGYVYLHAPDGYSQAVVRDTAAFSGKLTIVAWWRFILRIRANLLGFLPLVGLIFVLDKNLLQRRWLYNIVLGGLVSSMWILPQLVLYSRSSFAKHYVFPLAVIFVVLNSIGLDQFRRYFPRPGFTLVGLLLIANMTFQYLPPVWQSVQDQRTKIEAFNTVVTEVQTFETDAFRNLLVVSNPSAEREIALLVLLGEAKNYPSMYLDALQQQDVHYDILSQIYFSLEAVDPNSIDVIIGYLPVDEFLNHAATAYPAWFDVNDWVIHSIHAEYTDWSWNDFIFRRDRARRVSIDYVVLARKGESL